MKQIKFFILIVLVFSIFSCEKKIDKQPIREMRAVWVATVANIDWPSKRGLTIEQQKTEFITLLDMHKKQNMNAIVFQVRPTADAFYPSSIEPWAHWLSGKQGQDPGYNPLAFAIEETHKRCMEFHAWFNPYRVALNTDSVVFSNNHIINKHPEWFLKYGKLIVFDPGMPESREFFTIVIKDILKKYDIDAIHFDDYFYPYPDTTDFPDSSSFIKHKYNFTEANKGDWRRNNVSLLIKMVHDTIQKYKPYVKFGISPFSVWRNKTDDLRGSNTKACCTCYDHLYADILLWLKAGWVDYIVPQDYFPFGHKKVDFKEVQNWWSKNYNGAQVYNGQAIYRFGEDKNSKKSAFNNIKELYKQINFVRNDINIKGSFHFSSKSFKCDTPNVSKAFIEDVYKYPALIPAYGKSHFPTPEKPILSIEGNKLKWNVPANAWYYAVYKFKKGENTTKIKAHNLFAVIKNTEFVINDIQSGDYIFKISTLNRENRESELSEEVNIKNK